MVATGLFITVLLVALAAFAVRMQSWHGAGAGQTSAQAVTSQGELNRGLCILGAGVVGGISLMVGGFAVRACCS
jgi:ABC-type nickel/cobalt efflux system permease component RcnA